MAVPHYLHGEARHLRGEEAAVPPPIGIAVASSPCSVPPVPIDRVLGASRSGKADATAISPVARGFAAALEGAPVLVLIDPLYTSDAADDKALFVVGRCGLA